MISSASAFATSASWAAAARHSPSEVSRAGIATTSWRRSRTASSKASALARPMWPWLARAAYDARPASQPSATRKPATSAGVGVLNATSRHRDRMVANTSSTVGAHSIQTVRGLGSSMALSSALQACSVSRSASSTMRICQRLPIGVSDARRTRSRTSLTPIVSFSVRMTATSAWLPASTVRQSWQVLGHSGPSPPPPNPARRTGAPPRRRARCWTGRTPADR